MTVPQHCFNHNKLNFKEHESNWMTVDLWFSSMMGGGGKGIMQMRKISSIWRTTTNKQTQVFFSLPRAFLFLSASTVCPLSGYRLLVNSDTTSRPQSEFSFLNIQMWKAILGWFVNVGLWDMQSESPAFRNGFLVHSAWPLKPFLTRQLVSKQVICRAPGGHILESIPAGRLWSPCHLLSLRLLPATNYVMSFWGPGRKAPRPPVSCFSSPPYSREDALSLRPLGNVVPST